MHLKNEELAEEVNCLVLRKEERESVTEMRQFIERMLETDSLYKYKCTEKAQKHPKVRQIYNILDRNEDLKENQVEHKGSFKWIDRETKFCDLY